MALRKPSGGWRYEDLFALPDDGRRYEIIDGELYELPAPSVLHQIIIMNLIHVIDPVVRALGGQTLAAAVDVFFSGANPVEPDLMVLLPDRLALMSKRGIEGAPSLLIEVLSPSNRRHDLRLKRALYARGDVPEYWIVDPKAASIEVLVLDGDRYRTHVLADGDTLVTSPSLTELSVPAAAIFRTPVSL